MNYRSVVLFGKAALVEKQEEKMTTLRVFTEHMISGRWQDARIPDSQLASGIEIPKNIANYYRGK
ncbi:MAG: pyridoxamine 5'-phosphate oxidase family protein [Xenococcaceae cyanobacterium MO_188.B19]|nr:pyridoxamine 5'-phosphate oxidase family protein [Xenococcaceae cyanobacterium MO_188.B19]